MLHSSQRARHRQKGNIVIFKFSIPNMPLIFNIHPTIFRSLSYLQTLGIAVRYSVDLTALQSKLSI